MINEERPVISAHRQLTIFHSRFLAKYMLRIRFRPNSSSMTPQKCENWRKGHSNQVSDLKRTFLPDNAANEWTLITLETISFDSDVSRPLIDGNFSEGKCAK